MKFKENKKYRLTLKDNEKTMCLSKEILLSTNDGKDIFTLNSIGATTGRLTKSGYYIELKYLKPICVLKYNRS